MAQNITIYVEHCPIDNETRLLTIPILNIYGKPLPKGSIKEGIKEECLKLIDYASTIANSIRKDSGGVEIKPPRYIDHLGIQKLGDVDEGPSSH